MNCADLMARDVSLDEQVRFLECHCELLHAEHERTVKLIEHLKSARSDNFLRGSVVRHHPANQQALGASDEGAFGEQEKAA